MTPRDGAKGERGEGMHDMPMQLREAQLLTGTLDKAAGTIDVTWSAGARGLRYDWFSDTVYEEELDMSASAVDMSRFDAGVVHVLDDHQGRGLKNILGVATRGWLERGEGKATLKFGQRAEIAGIVGDIEAGAIRGISVGYKVSKYEVIPVRERTDGGKHPLWIARRWQPAEISFTAIPMDPRGTSGQRADVAVEPCEFTFIRAAAHQPQEHTVMGDTVTTPPAATQPQQPDVAAAERAAQAAERQRNADLTALCTRHNAVPMLAKFISDGVSVDQASRAILEQRAADDAAAGGGTRNVVHTRTERDETETRMAGVAEALRHRVDPKAELTDNGRQYRGMTLLEMGRDYLERAGVTTRGMDKMTLARNMIVFRSGGLLATSDFANILENVATKRLRAGYDENPGSFRRWARNAPNAPDFKSMSVVQLGGMPDLLRVNEHGEFTYGAFTDGKETYSLVTYGRIVGLTRQAIVNDDLRAFDRLVAGFGNSAARLENRTVYGILTANAALADGVALFHASHANLAGSGGAISATTLGAGRLAMRIQKGLQTEELNLAPRYLLVPAALEQKAYEFTSTNYVPATKAEINEFRAGGRSAVEPVIEPILDGNSATAWYLAADSAQVDTVEYCYLEGATGPVMESDMGFEIDGMSWKCRLDFAAKAIDHRGLYKNAGA